MESHDPHHSWDACRVDSLLLSYHDPPVESLLGHSVRLTFFGIYISSCFFFWDMPLWCLDPIQLRIWMTGIAHLMMDDPMLSDFLIYHTSDAALGHISVLVEICRSPVICMIIPTYEIQAETMTSLLSYHDLPWEPLLSHLVRPTLFGIWMSSCFSL